LYTGRGPVCGITTRRIGGAAGSAAWSVVRCAGWRETAPPAETSGATWASTSGAVADPSIAGPVLTAEMGASTATGGGAATTGAAAASAVTGAAGGVACGFVAGAACSIAGGTSRTGGFTTTAIGGGTTATAGRAVTAPAGALATTGPAGGRDAMAGACGAVTMGGAGRGAGTIFRGSGRAGAAGGAAATTAGFEGAAVAAGAGRAGVWLLRASASSSCFLARMAFITSPGLETWERSILGAIVCATREDAPLPWPAARDPRSNCARTLSASWSSIELEWVLPSPRPSSANTSRI
jgi:hypothetical protein